MIAAFALAAGVAAAGLGVAGGLQPELGCESGCASHAMAASDARGPREGAASGPPDGAGRRHPVAGLS